MKTIYSMQEFYNQVLELAKAKGEDFISTKVEMDAYRKLRFWAYVHHYDWHTGDTVDECLQKVREKLFGFGETFKTVDVEIEVEQELITSPEEVN